MVISLNRKCKIISEPIVIKAREVQGVDKYKYLGVIINNNLKFDKHVQSAEKRLKPRLYCLRKLNGQH